MHIMSQRTLSLVIAIALYLGSCRGYVALFEEGKEEPRQVFPYRISSLPPVDQLALEEGIPVRSEKQLQHLLEDFLS